MRKIVLAFGETLWDLFPTGAKLGGAPFNFAYRASSLGDRGIVASRLGKDDLGRKAREEIESLGLETDHIQWDDAYPTGTVSVSVDEKGAPHFTITPDVAYDHIETRSGLLDVARTADCVCFGTLVQRAPTTRRTLEQVLDASEGRLKLLDLNLRKDCYSRETIEASLARADILKLNDEEARYLADAFGMRGRSVPELAAGLLERWSLSCCLVTLAERGAFAASDRNEAAYVPGYRVDVVDTCGSGDAFTAGFIHRFLRGMPLAECCELGNALGAMVASQEGGTGRIAPEEVERFAASGHERTCDGELG